MGVAETETGGTDAHAIQHPANSAGAGKRGLSCKEAAERMVTKDSDVTRLLDRLEQQHLIKRERQEQDRRVVLTFITRQGTEVA